ncbi:hypothetical protein [Microbispora bryophytorum]|uniref:hypothetical protein n=1 Tax=Microbispora bryophytorum TaxID=1460882 RepID=UPI003410E259
MYDHVQDMKDHLVEGIDLMGASQPSKWAQDRFGGAAQALREKIPTALHRAHQRALAAYLGLGRKSNEAYGLIWLAQHEELIKELRGVEGFRTIKPKGARYELAVIGNIVLYPWRYSDQMRVPLEHARMDLSDVRRDLLALTAQPPDPQMTLDDIDTDPAVLQAKYEEAKEAIRQMAASGQLVLVAYVSNPQAGILEVEWGEATQADDDGHLVWAYHERIPLPPGHRDVGGGDQPGQLSPVAPSSGGPSDGVARRFDDAPLDEPLLQPRAPLTDPTSEPSAPQQETGSDD